MKKNKKSVSVKNTKSFLGNPPALVNTTFFVPAANLNSNDGIFTDLHDNPSNFSSSNQDPNWSFDISNKLFAQSGKKKIFADDKFKNMISRTPDMQDTYTGDLFSDDFAPTRYPYDSIEREVSPVLSQVDYPTYMTVEPQPVSVGVAPVDGDYFAPSMVYRDTFMNAEVLRQAEQSNSDFFAARGADTMGDYNYFPDADVSPIFAAQEVTRYTSGEAYPTEVGDAQIPLKIVAGKVMRENEYLRPEFLTSEMISSYSDEDLLKLIGQEEFDRLVASRYRDGILIAPTDASEMGDFKDSKSDTNNFPTASIQPTTFLEVKKSKKPYNWLPLLLVAAAVGGYMYYNRKK